MLETFIPSGEKGLKVSAKEEKLQHEKELNELRAKVGELVLEIDARKKLAALEQDQGMTC